MNRPDTIELAEKINSATPESAPISAYLATDERVIARITDGIYKRPASALRELISNAYDADAKRVEILTDYPRFDRIVVRDDGVGMDSSALANVIKHIGGSAKRTEFGTEIGITDPKNSSLTKGGRKIIGKIGIGLFAVAQLTRRFQIITKVAGNDYRLVADVLLDIYRDEESSELDLQQFKSGNVKISKVKALDREAHGTDIILMSLRKNAKNILKSADIWTRVDQAKTEREKTRYMPSYHIGQFEPDQTENWLPKYLMRLPWDSDTPLSDRFESIYQKLLEESEVRSSKPSLENTFDNYFQMLWELSLSSPISYLEKHPFLYGVNDEPKFFRLSGTLQGKAEPIKLSDKGFKGYLNTKNPIPDPMNGFHVSIDEIELKHPIKFNKQKKSDSALKTSLLFLGKYASPADSPLLTDNGGDLEFEAYFYWNSKILPLDHAGLLIRINDASGTLFDSKFLAYPVAERYLLSQISAEIFVVKGLDPALNIDRESFNVAHPHYQILMKWVHSALRQITAIQKELRAKAIDKIKNKNKSRSVEELERISESQFAPDQEVSWPVFADTRSETETYRAKGDSCFIRSEIFVENPPDDILELKLKSILRLLEGEGLLLHMNFEEQTELARKIGEILSYKLKEK